MRMSKEVLEQLKSTGELIHGDYLINVSKSKGIGTNALMRALKLGLINSVVVEFCYLDSKTHFRNARFSYRLLSVKFVKLDEDFNNWHKKHSEKVSRIAERRRERASKKSIGEKDGIITHWGKWLRANGEPAYLAQHVTETINV